MQIDVQGNPDFGNLQVKLAAGERILAESGAMSCMSPNLKVQSRLMGGFISSSFRKMFGGESLFVAEYTAEGDGFVNLSPSVPGTIVQRKMDGYALNLSAGAFLACTPGVDVKTRFRGLGALITGQESFYLQCGGAGDLFFNAYGGVIEKEVSGTLVVDTGHVVGWEPSLDIAVGGMGGVKATLFSGEGLVMNFSGQGKIYLQTRFLSGLAGWLTNYLRA